MDKRDLKALAEAIQAGNAKLEAELADARAFKERLALRKDIPDSVRQDLLLDRAKQSLEKIKDVLAETNDAFPATQDFLRARGLTSSRQLDEAGQIELSEYLVAMLERGMKGPGDA